MSEKYSALPIIEGISLQMTKDTRVIFGSSFPKDQEFTQVNFSLLINHEYAIREGIGFFFAFEIFNEKIVFML